MEMEARFDFIKEVGSGSYGTVSRAIDKESGEVVAIKRMKQKFKTLKECLNLVEVKSLRKMQHENIVKLKEVICQNQILYFVFEYMECNLYQVIDGRPERFSESQVRNICFQILQGLAYMHQQGYFHRDLKPENILVSKDSIVKIGDLGMAKELNSPPPYTDYVTTRWYRAPEVLLGSQHYGSEVDMWAMGVIMAELFRMSPLFPGSSQANQMYEMCTILGNPTMDSWPDGVQLARDMNYQFPQFPGLHLSLLIPSASEEAIDLISKLCSWDPNRRPTAVDALKHPFFQSCLYNIPPPSLPFELEQQWLEVYATRDDDDHGALADTETDVDLEWEQLEASLDYVREEMNDRFNLKGCAEQLLNVPFELGQQSHEFYATRDDDDDYGALANVETDIDLEWAQLEASLDYVREKMNDRCNLKACAEQLVNGSSPTKTNVSPSVDLFGVSDTADALATMAIGSHRPPFLISQH